MATVGGHRRRLRCPVLQDFVKEKVAGETGSGDSYGFNQQCRAGEKPFAPTVRDFLAQIARKIVPLLYLQQAWSITLESPRNWSGNS
mmetsp:Transcript_3287/g.20487  ORF Transcript_3287/g.20487 Transcript_3287/m.20487 type:complete len:87 (-) Transcript_3287:1073-1333(-)